MAKKKILALSHYSPIHNRAGGEIMLEGVLEAFAKSYTVDWIAFDNEGKDQKSKGINIKHGEKYYDKIDFNKYDIIISHFFYATYAQKKAEEYNKPFILLMHNDDTRGDYQELIPKSDLVIYNTHWIKASWEKKGIKAKNDIVIHPPVYPEQHRVDKTGDKVTLINSTIEKGGVMVFNLAKLMPHVQFLIVRGGYGIQQVDHLNFKNLKNVTIIDNQQDMKEVWKQAKILIAPSTYESYGMAMLEACASGIPVIYKDTDGLIECLGEGGISMENFSLAHWKTQIIKLLRDDDYYKKYSELAKEQSLKVDSKKELDVLVKKIGEL